MLRRRLALTAAALLAFLPASAAATDWPTYHGDNSRQGDDSTDAGLASPVGLWTSATLDGKVYGSPVVVGSQVVVATENDTVYSIDATSGAIQWATHVGTPRTSNFPCGNVDPLGVTSTPVVSGSSVYVAAEVQTSPTAFHFQLVTLDLASGAVTRAVTIDPPDPRFNADVQQQRGALTITDNKVFVPLGGLYGDCGDYHGYVLAYPLTGAAAVQWWADTEVDSANREGGIWAAGGLSVDPSGSVFASTGNSDHTTASSAYDFSDGVIKIDPNLVKPSDFFAPSTWYVDNAGDTDLGSSAVLQLPNNRALIVGKSGTGYLLDTVSLGHIGHPLAEHQVCTAQSDATFGSLAYASGTAFVGCSDGLVALRISGNDFATAWYTTTGVADHPPTVTGGAVWSVDSSGANLLGFDAATGELTHSFAIGSSTHFTTPTAANGELYVAADDHVVAFSTAPEPAVNGVTLDAYGSLHHFGSVASNTLGGQYWPGWQIARAVVALPDHSGGWVLDGWGGLTPFGSAPRLGGSVYWQGWDIARAVALDAAGMGGYVLDGWGGVHPVGDAPAVTGTAYWPGWDIARGLVLRSDRRSGWVLDGWGGLHPFAAQGTAMPADVSGPYWPGWDIARAVAATADGAGYVLDGWGGVHPYGTATAVNAAGYTNGWDVARGLSLYSRSPVAGYWVDAFGGLHEVGAASPAPAPAYLPGRPIFRGVAVTP